MFILIVIAVMVGLVVGYLTHNPFWGLAVLVMLAGGFYLQALRRILAKPPHKAQVTIFGKRRKKKVEVEIEKEVEKDGIKTKIKELETREVSFYKDEGLRLFPLYPLWYGYIPVKVERIVLEFESIVRTPDRANSKVPMVLTIRPFPDCLIEYIDSGGEEGVKTQLIGKIQERLREWAMAEEEGPADWRELNKSQLEAISVLIKAIVDKGSLTEIPKYAQDVPTFIWLRYFSRPRPTKFFENEKRWAEKDWREVEDELRKIKEMENGEDKKKKLEEAVENRRSDVVGLRVGTAKIVVPNLGIVIERLNLTDIKVLGEVEKRADAQAKEQEDRDAEGLELSFVEERIKKLIGQPFYYSREQAQELVQTERGKVAKTINESKWNIAPETREMIEKIGSQIIPVIKGGDKNE